MFINASVSINIKTYESQTYVFSFILIPDKGIIYINSYILSLVNHNMLANILFLTNISSWWWIFIFILQLAKNVINFNITFIQHFMLLWTFGIRYFILLRPPADYKEIIIFLVFECFFEVWNMFNRLIDHFAKYVLLMVQKEERKHMKNSHITNVKLHIKKCPSLFSACINTVNLFFYYSQSRELMNHKNSYPLEKISQ